MDIGPNDFASLTLPVYKAMFDHMPKSMTGFETSATTGRRAAVTAFNHYTSASFGRILALARQRLNLTVDHFEAVRDTIIADSGLVLAPKLKQEQVRHRPVAFKTKGVNYPLE